MLARTPGEPLVARPVGVGGHDPEHARPGRRGADGGPLGLAVGQLRGSGERLLARPAKEGSRAAACSSQRMRRTRYCRFRVRESCPLACR